MLQQTFNYVPYKLELEGKDFCTMFKEMKIMVNSNNDLIVHSIVANLALRGFEIDD